MTYTVDNYGEPFPTKTDASGYAKTASEMFGLSRVVVREDGQVIETWYQGRKLPAAPSVDSTGKP